MAIEQNSVDLAVKLNNYNIERQTECDNIYREAKKLIDAKALAKRNIILVENEDWKIGFIGIVAARLVEEYARPVIVFAGHEACSAVLHTVDEIAVCGLNCSVL